MFPFFWNGFSSLPMETAHSCCPVRGTHTLFQRSTSESEDCGVNNTELKALFTLSFFPRRKRSFYIEVSSTLFLRLSS